MKKYFLILFAGIVAVASSCNNDSKKSDEPVTAETKTDPAVQKNLDVVHTINKAFESGDIGSIRKYIDDNAVDHAGLNGDVFGGDSIVAAISQWTKMVSGMKGNIKKEFADNDVVIQWMTISGKMINDGFGMKAGTSYSQDVVEVSKFNAAGKITEHWEFFTIADMMKMMGGGQPK